MYKLTRDISYPAIHLDDGFWRLNAANAIGLSRKADSGASYRSFFGEEAERPMLPIVRLRALNEDLPFREYRLANFQSCANFSGVYILTRKAPAKRILFRSRTQYKHTIIYVGHTDDIVKRHASHNRQASFTNYGANHILILEERDSERRDLITNDLIATYNPPCNT